jgi:hypothetical protein
MTREQKERKITLCIKRVKRLTTFAEVVNKWNEPYTNMRLALRVVMTVIEANRFVSQPAEPKPSFRRGGIHVNCGCGLKQPTEQC